MQSFVKESSIQCPPKFPKFAYLENLFVECILYNILYKFSSFIKIKLSKINNKKSTDESLKIKTKHNCVWINNLKIWKNYL